MALLVYRIDAEDRLSYMNSAWSEGPPHAGVSSQHVLGRLLWDCFADNATRALYGHLVKRARAGRASHVDYRCDTAERLRWFDMSIVSLGDGVVEFTSRLVKEEPRPKVLLLADDRPRDDRHVLMCGWCQRIRMAEGFWLAIDHAVRQLGLLKEETIPKLTHGICGECASRLRQLEAEP